MKFVLVNSRYPPREPIARCAASRSANAICGKSERTSPTAIMIATLLTATALSGSSKAAPKPREAPRCASLNCFAWANASSALLRPGAAFHRYSVLRHARYTASQVTTISDPYPTLARLATDERIFRTLTTVRRHSSITTARRLLALLRMKRGDEPILARKATIERDNRFASRGDDLAFPTG